MTPAQRDAAIAEAHAAHDAYLRNLEAEHARQIRALEAKTQSAADFAAWTLGERIRHINEACEEDNR